jgi:hypothetical protein
MNDHNQHINHIKTANSSESPPTKRGFLKKLADGIFEILGGEFLMHNKARRQFNYVFFLAAIALLYIANNYYAERTSRQIDNLNRELKELHYAYISSKSVLMHESKQSEVARKLKSTGIKESVEPVKRLVANKN